MTEGRAGSGEGAQGAGAPGRAAEDGSPLIFESLSTVFSEGKTTALVGPSGGGKTTLVNLVGRFYDPVGGRVCVDQRDIREVTLRSLRGQIAVVPEGSGGHFRVTLPRRSARALADAA